MTIASWLPLALLATLATGGRGAETEAQRLHRRGVQCMDDIERPDCAIENFEALMEVPTADRELMTDGMLRLIRLYRGGGDAEAVKPILRRFWDAGMKRDSRGHVPFSTRFVPKDFDILLNVDVERVLAAPLTKRLGDDARDTLFTCDEIRRTSLEETRRVKRATRRAKDSGRDFETVLAEDLAREKKREDEQAAARARGDAGPKGQPAPIMFESSCAVALALGDNDLSHWQRMTTVFSHHDFGRSIMLSQIPGLDAKLTAAVDGARLIEVEPGHWRVPNLQYEGGDVDLAQLDLDELLIAPTAIIDEMIAARRSRKRSMDRALEQLINKVPRDTGFFVVLTQSALLDLGFAGVKPGARGFFAALLPKPKGMQIAGVLGEDFGLFTRMPTDSAVKGRALVLIARAMIERRAGDDGNSEELLKSLDVAEASDRRALLASYVLSAAQLQKFMLE